MNTKEYKILVVILIVIAAIVIGYGLTKHSTTVTTTPAVTTSPTGSTVSTLSVVSIHENASDTPQVSIEYPQFTSLPPSADEAIASSTMSRLADFRETVKENMAARFATGGTHDEIASSSYSFNATWQQAQISDRYISFIIRYDSYSGGANENQEVQTFNYDVASGTPITLEDLFPNVQKPLQKISSIVRQQLRSSLASASQGNVSDQMLDEGTAPLDENFANFTFTDNAITFYFPKYAVAPGSFGEQKAVILRSDIK